LVPLKNDSLFSCETPPFPLQVRDGILTQQWSINKTWQWGNKELPTLFNFSLDCRYDIREDRLKGQLVVDEYDYWYMGWNESTKKREWKLVHKFTLTCEVVSDYIVPNAEGLVVKIRDIYPQRGMCAVKYHVDKEYAESIPQSFSGILGPFKVVWLGYKPTRSDGTGSSYDEGCEGQVEDSGARFDQIIGEVEVRPCDDPDGWRIAKHDMVIYTNDRIETGEKSWAVISDPRSVYTMKPESEVIIKFSLTLKEENVLVLMYGNLMANIKRTIKEGALDIQLGQAVLGTKGTTFVAEERNGISRLKVIEGEVKFRSKATGETQLVKAGEEIYADKKKG